jgi:release factor glutamine methyltransferase
VLRAGGIVFDEREADWIVEAGTGLSRTGRVVSSAAPAEDRVAATLDLARRRAAGEPLQYVTGVAGFRHLDLAVGPGVFIPRPETEEVVARAMGHLPKAGTLVDVGTGSGAIALSVSRERPDARVFATETSPEALAWATKNRDALAPDVELIQCDLLEGLPADLMRAVDVVVSNPPYVPTDEAHLLPGDVADHEPRAALFPPGDALSVIRAVAASASTWLCAGGWLVLEIGQSQETDVADHLRNAGYDEVAVLQDQTGRPRIVEGRRP